MVIDPSPVVVCAQGWRPNRKWETTIRAPYDALSAGATGIDAARAWAEVAMMMGDSRAAPLALVVCLHAEHGLADGHEARRLAAHRHLCMLDLGLTRAVSPGAIPLVDFGKPDRFEDRPGDLAAWLARALVPFEGDLARAAMFGLRIAAIRTGIIPGPDPAP
jgi:hypothetical protein